jgi:hypothetical protein
MRKKQAEHEEMMSRQQNAKKMFEQKVEPSRPTNGVGKAVDGTTKSQPSRARLEMNASLDEQAENFEKALQIEQQQQQQARIRGQPPPAIKLVPEKLELEKENINGTRGGKQQQQQDEEEEVVGKIGN